MSSPSTTIWPARQRLDGPGLPLPRPQVGCIVHGLDDAERRQAYAADITYGTNNEFGFDYLRDNMKFRLEDMVQRPFNYAIVDEVDSDPDRRSAHAAHHLRPGRGHLRALPAGRRLIPLLAPEDFEKDEKQRQVALTDSGVEKIEEHAARDRAARRPGHALRHPQRRLVHHVNQALRAHKLFARDVDYIVKDDKVVIIDEFTGRMMEGRRYSEGLHQALEAKETCRRSSTRTRRSPRSPSRTISACIPKLAGMTGTAMTEAGEFAEIYKLEVVEMPTNMPCMRKDERRRGLSHRAREIRGDHHPGIEMPASASSRCWSAPSASRNRSPARRC